MNLTSLHKLFLFAVILFYIPACSSGDDASDAETKREINSSLFLLSKGLKTDALKGELLKLLEKDASMYSVAVVVNASSTEKKKRKKTRKIKLQFHELGFDSSRVEMFDLMTRNSNELKNFDIIYILGGNPFLLLDQVNKSGSRDLLYELAYQNKILMGYSAGALLLGPDLSLMNSADSLLGFNELGLQELDCIGLYDFYIFPHYDDFTAQAPELITVINDFESGSKLPVQRLNDDQGIIFQNGKMRIIGK